MKLLNIFLILFILLSKNMLNGQNQVIIRYSILHCQRGITQCEKCQESFKYQYMLIDFQTNPMHASPMIEHDGVLKAYKVIELFHSLTEAKEYAQKNNIPIIISDIDTDEVLKKIQKKVTELGWHMTCEHDKLTIFSVYPVKEIETGKKVLPTITFILRPLNSKINFAYFYTDKYKVIEKTYSGIHSKMNPVIDNPKEDALQKVREIENFLLQFNPK